MKPERQVISGAKSSVSGIGTMVEVGCVDFCMTDFSSCMSNSCGVVAVLWVVVSPYLGEAKATMLWGGLEDGPRLVIIQMEVVGIFRRQGMSTGRQFRRCSWNCIVGVPWVSSFVITPSAPTVMSVGRPSSGDKSWTVSLARNGCGA